MKAHDSSAYTCTIECGAGRPLGSPKENGKPLPCRLFQLRAVSRLGQLLLAVVAAQALLACLSLLPVARLAAKNVFRAAYYSADPLWLGRNEARFPGPAACPSRGGDNPLVLTYIRSDDYLPLLRQFECTFRRSNPGVELGVMTVPGELGEETLAWLDSHQVTRIEVDPLNYENKYRPSYGRNWLKLRAWGLTQYSAILLIDADTLVLRPLAPLFAAPFVFAAGWDQSRVLGRLNTRLKGINGGVLLLRPCEAVQQHMLSLLEEHPKLRFTYAAAEQDFLGWYFRFTGAMLPVEYNTMASDSLHGNVTIGGQAPAIVHFTQNKPFAGAVPGKPGHQFLCSAEELRRSRSS